MFLFRPHTEASLKVGIYAIPIVLVFVFFFNLYYSNYSRKSAKEHSSPANNKSYLVVIFLFIIVTAIFLSKFL